MKKFIFSISILLVCTGSFQAQAECESESEDKFTCQRALSEDGTPYTEADVAACIGHHGFVCRSALANADGVYTEDDLAACTDAHASLRKKQNCGLTFSGDTERILSCLSTDADPDVVFNTCSSLQTYPGRFECITASASGAEKQACISVLANPNISPKQSDADIIKCIRHPNASDIIYEQCNRGHNDLAELSYECVLTHLLP